MSLRSKTGTNNPTKNNFIHKIDKMNLYLISPKGALKFLEVTDSIHVNQKCPPNLKSIIWFEKLHYNVGCLMAILW